MKCAHVFTFSVKQALAPRKGNSTLMLLPVTEYDCVLPLIAYAVSPSSEVYLRESADPHIRLTQLI